MNLARAISESSAHFVLIGAATFSMNGDYKVA